MFFARELALTAAYLTEPQRLQRSVGLLGTLIGEVKWRH